jgi:hypothetical protein
MSYDLGPPFHTEKKNKVAIGAVSSKGRQNARSFLNILILRKRGPGM